MDRGKLGWSVALAGLSFVPFFDRRVALWHVQTHWVWLTLLVMGTYTLATGVKVDLPANKPLAFYMAWTLGMILFIFHKAVAVNHGYPLEIFKPVFHFSIITLFYLLIVSTWCWMPWAWLG